MAVKNSIKQMLRTPFKSMGFLILVIMTCALLTTGVNLWTSNQNSLKKFEEQFMTIGTVEQTASSVSQSLEWNAATKGYDIYQFPEYAGIYSLSVLDFEGADYVCPPEKRSYYGSYAPDYKLAGGEIPAGSAPVIVEFSPAEDCVPDESVKIKIQRVFNGSRGLEGSSLFFCDHSNETPEPLCRNRTYIAYIGFNNWTHGECINEGEEGRKPEYNPLSLSVSSYGEDGAFIDDSLGQLNSYYEVTAGFYETEIGKRYLNFAEGLELLQSTFPVTGTNCTELLMPFYEGDTYIAEGRDISGEEYQEGKAVCLVSDIFAENNELEIGSQVHTRLYYTNSRNPASGNFFRDGGSSFNFNVLDATGKVPSAFEEKEYEIVGIYAADPGTMDIGGDEMIVPMNSIENRDKCNIVSYGPMSRETTSFRIPNGTIEEFMQEWEKQGITDMEITFYDKGYSVLKSGIENMKIMSVILSLTGLGLGIALLLFINHLYVSGQKKKIAVERGLGLSKKTCMVSLLAGIYLILIIGCGAGGGIGFEISKNISASDLKTEVYDRTFSNTSAAGGEGVSALGADGQGAEAGVSAACAGVMILAGICIMAVNAGEILKAEPMQLLTDFKIE